MFEDLRHKRSIMLLLSLTDPVLQSKITDHEIDIIKNLTLEKVHRQRILKDYVVMCFL